MAGNTFTSQAGFITNSANSISARVDQSGCLGSFTATFHSRVAQAGLMSGVWTAYKERTTQAGFLVCVVTCDSSTYVPPNPTGVITLTAASAGVDTHAINLAWNAVPGFSYAVRRSLVSGGPYTTIVSGLTATSYQDTGLTYHQTYYYIIVGSDVCGDTTTSNEAHATADCTLPSVPMGLSAAFTGRGVQLAWDVVAGATYDVYRGLLSGHEAETPIATGLSSPAYFDPWTVPGLVFYKVDAVNSCGFSGLSSEGYAFVSSTPSVSSCTNGFDIMAEVQVRLRESQSTVAQQQSMIYLRHVRRALDEVGRRTWSLFDTAVCDLIANQVEYVMPRRPFELRSVSINDSNGNIFPIAGLTVSDADEQFPNWRNTNVGGPLWSGVPTYYVDEGSNRFWLLPTPSYNQQAGLLIAGYYGVDKWYTMDMCIPLPEGYDEAVTLATAWRRCVEMAPQDPLYREMLPDYKRDFEEICCRLYSERIRRTEASRNTIPSSGKRVTSWVNGWGWVSGT
jgi:hypothetical protein